MSTRLSNLTRPPTQKRDAITPGLSKAVYITSLTLMVFIAACKQKSVTWPTEGEGEPEPQETGGNPIAKKEVGTAPLSRLAPSDDNNKENDPWIADDGMKHYTAKNSPSGLYQAFRQMCIRIAMEVGYDEIAQTKVFRSTDSDIGPTETVVETQLIDGMRHATITITPPPAPDGDGYFIRIGHDVFRIFISPLVFEFTYNPTNKRSGQVKAQTLGFADEKMLQKFLETIWWKILRTT